MRRTKTSIAQLLLVIEAFTESHWRSPRLLFNRHIALSTTGRRYLEPGAWCRSGNPVLDSGIRQVRGLCTRERRQTLNHLSAARLPLAPTSHQRRNSHAMHQHRRGDDG